MVVALASWDERLGPVVLAKASTSAGDEATTKADELGVDVELVAIRVFMTMETVFGDEGAARFERTLLSLPIKSEGRVALVVFDAKEDPDVRGGKRPFVVFALVPEENADHDRVAKLSPLLEAVAGQFQSTGSVDLEAFVPRLRVALAGDALSGEFRRELDEAYSLSAAVEDFQRGVELFRRKELAAAASLLRRAHLKFAREGHVALRVEAAFALANALTNLRRYDLALNYYEELVDAGKSGNAKYYERAMFMAGFCHYKLGNPAAAVGAFEELSAALKGSDRTRRRVNPCRFHAIFARALVELGDLDRAALEYAESLACFAREGVDATRSEEVAELAFELGDLRMRTGNPEAAVDQLEEAAHAFGRLELPGAQLRAVASLKRALRLSGRPGGPAFEEVTRSLYELAGRVGDVPTKLAAAELLLDEHLRDGDHEAVVRLLEDFLSSTRHGGFLDRRALARFFSALGDAYFELRVPGEAKSNWVAALGVFEGLAGADPAAAKGALDVANRLAALARDAGDEDEASYYEERAKEAERMRRSSAAR
ncbi:MAG: hypothetical protein Kow0069_09180 [Promethearchaeota archaeon]